MNSFGRFASVMHLFQNSDLNQNESFESPTGHCVRSEHGRPEVRVQPVWPHYGRGSGSWGVIGRKHSALRCPEGRFQGFRLSERKPKVDLDSQAKSSKGRVLSQLNFAAGSTAGRAIRGPGGAPGCHLLSTQATWPWLRSGGSEASAIAMILAKALMTLGFGIRYDLPAS